MKERIGALIAAGGPADEAGFEAAALDLWAWQVAHNPEYRAFCGEAAPSGWRAIPAVPVGLFRELALTCFPAEQARVVFRTSGTTAERSGFHRLLDTDVYNLGARLGAARLVGAIPGGGVSLVTPAAHSSLGHMCRLFAPELGWFFSAEGGLDRAGALAALREARDPVFLPATAFALADLLFPEDEADLAPISLPAGSLVMITGGFKGRRRRVDERALGAAARAAFPGARVVGEYGMTELSSQLWAVPFEAPFRPPPWLRVYAVDPATGEPTEGPGQLRFVDLANHQTVLAIETQDHGIVAADGAVTLLGRLPDAPARGCSLDAERLGEEP